MDPKILEKLKSKKKIFILGLIIILIMVFAAILILQREGIYNKVIKVSGNIEGDDVKFSFRVQGQITDLFTDEGKVVKVGDVVAKLNTDELSRIKDEAEASLKAEEYRNKLAEDDYFRAEKLFEVGSISAQKRDSFKTAADSTKANIDQLEASLELAKTRLGFTDLISTLNGYVIVKSALPGEVVQIGAPVFTAIDLNNIWLTAYINETDLGKVKLGQKAYIKTDAYKNKKYEGYISFISPQEEFTPKFIQTQEERVKMVYRIKIRADNKDLELKPGMPADGFIILE